MNAPDAESTSYALGERRRQIILELVAQRRYVTISEVRQATRVSNATVYRDLDLLSRAGRISRVRGGATFVAQPSDELLELRRQLNQLARWLQPDRLSLAQQILMRALVTCERLLDANNQPPNRTGS